MKPELSIIIPCYNCASTLEEAVESCFRQNLTDFEIVMVDDGSTDGTRDIMESLARRHPEAHALFHDKNKGGGAARNTAVENSLSENIFCLDSDDILADGMLRKMVDMRENKKCDGVGISTSKKFQGEHGTDVVNVDSFGYVGQKIPFESLFQKKGILCPLYSTFLFTKRAFAITGGYPTTHGFDTQGFAWRFLGNGLTAYTCPDTTYMHRVNFHESYYLREYNSGKVNRNWREILEEFMFLLSADAQGVLMRLDGAKSDENLMDAVSSVACPAREGLDEYLSNGSRELHARRLETPTDNRANEADIYWLGCFYMTKGLYEKALASFERLTEPKTESRAVRVKMTLCRKALAGATSKELARMSDRLYGVTSKKSLRGIMRRIIRKARGKMSLLTSIMSERGYHPRLILAFLWLKARVMLRIGFNDADITQTEQVAVDVVIPTATKDFDLLKSLVDSLSHLRARIGTIHIIGPDSPILEAFCAENGYSFVPENSLLPGIKASIRYVIDEMDLSGWILQQLLKFKAADIVGSENYFVIDSDTVLTRGHSLMRGGKTVFLESAEWHEPYFTAFEKIFGERARNRTSSICHMMTFNRKRVLEMRNEIERRHGSTWEKAILARLDYTKRSCFSEFETYSNWMRFRHPDEMTRIPFYNKSLPRSEFERTRKRLGEYSDTVKSLSFHSYEVPKITKTNEK